MHIFKCTSVQEVRFLVPRNDKQQNLTKRGFNQLGLLDSVFFSKAGGG